MRQYTQHAELLSITFRQFPKSSLHLVTVLSTDFEHGQEPIRLQDFDMQIMFALHSPLKADKKIFDHFAFFQFSVISHWLIVFVRHTISLKSLYHEEPDHSVFIYPVGQKKQMQITKETSNILVIKFLKKILRSKEKGVNV